MQTLHIRTLTALLLVLLWIHSAVAQEPAQETEKDLANRRYTPEMFEEAARAEWQRVDRVIEAMGLREGDDIADIGGGSGYFSRPFARRVGKTGIVYCCDFAVKLLDYLQEAARRENLNNIVTVYAALDRPMLPPQSVDIAFSCNTNHHISDRVDYYQRLRSNLRPGGKVVIIDWYKRDQEVGPPASHNLAKAVVLQEMKEAGYQLIQEETFLPYQYFLIYQ